MKQTSIESFSLDTTEVISLAELAQCCGMTVAELDELVDYNALMPVARLPERGFSAHWVAPLRTASRLRLDYDLDVFTVAILLEKLIQIELLERQLQSLQALVPAHLRQP